MKENKWFTLKQLPFNVWGIGEFAHSEKVISYLLVGEKKALLFDTGMGKASIKEVVEQVTSLPVVVVNSHSHFDHVGGNKEFEKVMVFNHPVTKELVGKNQSLSGVFDNGEILDFPPFNLEVLHTPGHSPESICLFEKRLRFLLSGDTVYPGPIYLYLKNSDFKDYQKSIQRLVQKNPRIIFPGHNGFLMQGKILEKIAIRIKQGICSLKIDDKINLLISL